MVASADGRAEVATKIEASKAGAVTITVADADAPLPPFVFSPVVGLPGFGPPRAFALRSFPTGGAGFETLLTVTVTAVLMVTRGAVNIPSLEIVPAVVDQITAVLELSLMRALNCSFPKEATVAALGESVSVDDVLGSGALEFAAFCDDVRELQPTVNALRPIKSDRMTTFGIRNLSSRMRPAASNLANNTCIWGNLVTELGDRVRALYQHSREGNTCRRDYAGTGPAGLTST